MQEYRDSPAGKGECFAPAPHPATWFNGERWKDDRAEWYKIDTRRFNETTGPPSSRQASIAALGTSHIPDDPRIARQRVYELAKEKLRNWREMPDENAIIDRMKREYPEHQLVIALTGVPI